MRRLAILVWWISHDFTIYHTIAQKMSKAKSVRKITGSAHSVGKRRRLVRHERLSSWWDGCVILSYYQRGRSWIPRRQRLWLGRQGVFHPRTLHFANDLHSLGWWCGTLYIIVWRVEEFRIATTNEIGTAIGDEIITIHLSHTKHTFSCSTLQ